MPPSTRDVNSFHWKLGGERSASETSDSDPRAVTEPNHQDIGRSSGNLMPTRSSQPHDRRQAHMLKARGGTTQTDRPKYGSQSSQRDRSPCQSKTSSPKHHTRADGSVPARSSMRSTVKLQNTNSSDLPASQSNHDTPTALRIQSTLECTGGDYSRYLSANMKGDKAVLGPSNYAQLALARRRDVGLQGRNKILKIVNASLGTGSETHT